MYVGIDWGSILVSAAPMRCIVLESGLKNLHVHVKIIQHSYKITPCNVKGVLNVYVHYISRERRLLYVHVYCVFN